jgi:hypothetical protein
VTFTVQRERSLDGKCVPVVRYDKAHGFAIETCSIAKAESFRKQHWRVH